MQYARHGLASLQLLAGLALAAAAPALQPTPPARIANEWGGKDHQPTRAGVNAAEQALGIGLSRAQKQAEDRQLETIERQLLKNAGSSTPMFGP